MEVLYPRCAGLDVHKETRRGLRAIGAEGRFGRAAGRDLRDDDPGAADAAATGSQRARRARHVAMESTGVYWKPVWHVLEGSFELVLANADAHPATSRVARPT